MSPFKIQVTCRWWRRCPGQAGGDIQACNLCTWVDLLRNSDQISCCSFFSFYFYLPSPSHELQAWGQARQVWVWQRIKGNLLLISMRVVFSWQMSAFLKIYWNERYNLCWRSWSFRAVGDTRWDIETVLRVASCAVARLRMVIIKVMIIIEVVIIIKAIKMTLWNVYYKIVMLGGIRINDAENTQYWVGNCIFLISLHLKI